MVNAGKVRGDSVRAIWTARRRQGACCCLQMDSCENHNDIDNKIEAENEDYGEENNGDGLL